MIIFSMSRSPDAENHFSVLSSANKHSYQGYNQWFILVDKGTVLLYLTISKREQKSNHLSLTRSFSVFPHSLSLSTVSLNYYWSLENGW